MGPRRTPIPVLPRRRRGAGERWSPNSRGRVGSRFLTSEPWPVRNHLAFRAEAAEALITLDVINGRRYDDSTGMIKGFRDRDTERVFRREKSRRWAPTVQRMAQRRLLILDAAESLNELRVPPGNRLEKLSRDRRGQYSIRINDRWRICFRWTEGDAFEVEITDYH